MNHRDPEKEIVGIECRHATYCQPPEYGMKDLHVIKTVRHLKDGTTTPELELKWDMPRHFWITKKGKRNHKEKREFEEMENLDKFTCTESTLIPRIKRALDVQGGQNNRLRILARSPFLYGVDISSTSIIKQRFRDQFPNLQSACTVAATDVETDMLNGTNEIIMQSITMKNRVFTAIVRSFFKGYSDVENQLRIAFQKYLADDIKERKLEWEIEFVDDAAEVVRAIANKAHEWRPDFVAIWNILFDMEKMLEALEKKRQQTRDDSWHPAQIFSDPKVPPEYRHFNFRIGPAQKVKADGTATPLSPSQRWHSVSVPASFSFIDAMCAYRHIRTGRQEEQEYNLDYIMNKNVKRQKLKFEEADGFVGGDWHEFMQEYYKFEYVIYNLFDCIGMEILDEETADLSMNLSLYSGCSDYSIFNSQPKRLCNEFHFHLLKRNRVLATTSDQMRMSLDDKTVNGKGWITMLPAHLVMDNGLRVLKEMKDVPSNIRIGVGDLDISGTYPNEGICMNISKYTTHRELLYIEGIPDDIRRRIGFNLAGGHVNAVEICCDLFKAPSLDDVYMAYMRSKDPNFGKKI